MVMLFTRRAARATRQACICLTLNVRQKIMSYIPQSIEKIAALGANVSINAEKMIPQSAERIAQICVSHGGHLTIRNAAHWIPQSLERIAAIAKNRVTFEID
jgi:histidinol phosphatase-like PHP family hydrolase